jgi:hypothetical protein|tara:strand:- start:637 stop:849 length:213 start_codon:yes stop_codon:yes gene_type:complete
MKRPNRKEYIGKATKIQLIADQEKYIDFIEKQLEAINNTDCCETLPCSYAEGYNDAIAKIKEEAKYIEKQ